jgi:hypothetical protein
MHRPHDRRDSFLAGGRPLGVVAARDVLADAKHVGNVGQGTSARQNVGRQGVAETMGVRRLFSHCERLAPASARRCRVLNS